MGMEDGGETINKTPFLERGVRGRLGGPGHASPLTSPVDIRVLPSRSEVAEADSLERMQGHRVASLTEFTFHSSPLLPSLPIYISCARTVKACLFSACKILVAKEIVKEQRRVVKQKQTLGV